MQCYNLSTWFSLRKKGIWSLTEHVEVKRTENTACHCLIVVIVRGRGANEIYSVEDEDIAEVFCDDWDRTKERD